MFFLVPIVFLAVLYAWAISAFPRLARRKRSVAVVFGSLWLFVPLSHFLLAMDLPSTLPRGIVEQVGEIEWSRDLLSS